MLDKVTILEVLKSKKEFLFDRFNLSRLALIGSFAKDLNVESSDVDVLLEFLPKTENLFDKKRELKSLLQDLFQKEVDICRAKYIKPYFKKQILDSAIDV